MNKRVLLLSFSVIIFSVVSYAAQPVPRLVNNPVLWGISYCTYIHQLPPNISSKRLISVLCISDDFDPIAGSEPVEFALATDSSDQEQHPHGEGFTWEGFAWCSGVGCRAYRAIGTSPGTRTFRGVSSAARGHHR
jgi:hypothetical protein